jgi:hypothetical protein
MVIEENKAMVTSRYWKEYTVKAPNTRPKDERYHLENEHGPKYENDVSASSWLRAAGESAEGKPNYGRSKPRER